MEIKRYTDNHEGYFIRMKQYVSEENQFTPVSAFLSLCGLILPFTETPDTIIPFLLLLSPLYLNRRSRILSIVLIIVAIFCPLKEHGKAHHWIARLEENDIILRILLLVDATYVGITFRKTAKYIMSPASIENQHFPLII